MNIIGLSGKKGSGKDFVGKIIQRLAGHGKLMPFAGSIKEICRDYFGLDPAIMYGTNEQKNTTLTEWRWEDIPRNGAHDHTGKFYTINGKVGFITYREMLQMVGTEVFRDNVHEDFWVKCTLNKIKNDKTEYNKPIRIYGFDDRSQEGWRDNFKKENLFVITDVRFPNEVEAIKSAGGVVVRVHGGQSADNDKHPSETALDHLDRLTISGSRLYEMTSVTELNALGTSLTKILNPPARFDYLLENYIMDERVLTEAIEELLIDLGEIKR
jgi:hypothetical protein